MIIVEVKVRPFGYGEEKLLGTCVIANDGSGTEKRGNYYARLYGKRKRRMKPETITVKNHPRKSYHVWKLVYKVLKEIYG